MKQIRNNVSLLIVVMAISGMATSASLAQDQTQSAHPCSSPEFRQFDFWIGQWDITGRYRTSDSTWSEEGAASNIVTVEYNSCVIIENFRSTDFELNGHSVSTYNKNRKIWQQTWVDNSGSYFDFTGGLDSAGQMALYTEREQGGKTIKYRMVFQNIKKNSLFWVWERSGDGGQTWYRMFELNYKRKP